MGAFDWPGEPVEGAASCWVSVDVARVVSGYAVEPAAAVDAVLTGTGEAVRAVAVMGDC